jgi:hypothetical protein
VKALPHNPGWLTSPVLRAHSLLSLRPQKAQCVSGQQPLRSKPNERLSSNITGA